MSTARRGAQWRGAGATVEGSRSPDRLPVRRASGWPAGPGGTRKPAGAHSAQKRYGWWLRRSRVRPDRNPLFWRRPVVRGLRPARTRTGFRYAPACSVMHRRRRKPLPHRRGGAGPPDCPDTLSRVFPAGLSLRRPRCPSGVRPAHTMPWHSSNPAPRLPAGGQWFP